MSRRRLYLDRAPGETRGVVTLAGRPERLIGAAQDLIQVAASLSRKLVCHRWPSSSHRIKSAQPRLRANLRSKINSTKQSVAYITQIARL